MGDSIYMSTNSIDAYNRILSDFGLKATTIMDKESIKTTQDNRNLFKEQLKKGNIVNSGLYRDAPRYGEPYKQNDLGEDIKPSKGHRVNIVGFDDARGEWIVNDSAEPNQLIRYKFGDFELGNGWSTVLVKK